VEDQAIVEIINSFNVVGDFYLRTALNELNRSPVNYPLTQSFVPVVSSRHRPIRAVTSLQVGAGVARPQKGPGGKRLIESIDLNGVVGEGGSEVRPPIGIAVICIRSGISQYVDAVDPELYR
jgi:hypothetical protein